MLTHNYSEREMENLAKWRGKLEGKRVELICNYKNGEIGTVIIETVDAENDRPYMFVKLNKPQTIFKDKYEVFWYDEIKLIEDEK